MLKISDEQYRAIESDGQNRRMARLMDTLRATAGREIGDAELRALIERERERANAHGVISEERFAKWCRLVLNSPQSFPRSRETEAVLRTADLGPGDDPLEVLVRHLDAQADRGRDQRQ